MEDPLTAEEAAAVLNGITGAFERAQHVLEQAKSGAVVPLKRLTEPVDGEGE